MPFQSAEEISAKIYVDDLVTRVYDRLKMMIRAGVLKPGKKILQEEIADRLGVSRTPLLKALQKLEEELLVESLPRRGMIVKEFSLADLIDAYDCREGIEGIAARLAAQRATDEERTELAAIFQRFVSMTKIGQTAYSKADRRFHQMTLTCARNNILARTDMVGNIQDVTFARRLNRKPRETLIEHMAIVDAISRGDGAMAEERMRRHIRRSRQHIERAMTPTTVVD